MFPFRWRESHLSVTFTPSSDLLISQRKIWASHNMAVGFSKAAIKKANILKSWADSARYVW